ncbi:hypothetical protein CWE09_01000 [Aliidiomarina minuta]|uniref:Uncharacterized protein n=1 Tax=Aliidiomarina minuta TaxID=880057 RepID=A0A432W5J7_9GAMM|nr:hypothetical protein [Aliidiomarina minuta]RUO25344.1 hypothetical protein CWE09_01000 [Aliidiomarina minuta]
MKSRGQVLVEFLIAAPVLAMLILWAFPYLHNELQLKFSGQQLAQLSLAQAHWRQSNNLEMLDLDFLQTEMSLPLADDKQRLFNRSADYSFARALAPVGLLLQNQSGLAMRSDNLWQVALSTEDTVWMSYYRLADDWSPSHPEQLNSRPQALLGSSLLNNSLMHNVQRVFGVLPVARELRPNQLIFGYVDNHAVPEQALCTTQECSE